MKQQFTGYHFTDDKLRDGRPIPKVGTWLKHEGEIGICFRGLHASKHPFDALQYAPGNILHKVILRGELQSGGDPIDKYAGRERKILKSINAEKLLRDFARWSALKVVHLWDAPQVVKHYLKTGDARDAFCAAFCDEPLNDSLIEFGGSVKSWPASGAPLPA
jgi:hypothetical protein